MQYYTILFSERINQILMKYIPDSETLTDTSDEEDSQTVIFASIGLNNEGKINLGG